MAAIAIFHEVKPLSVLIFHLYEILFHSKLYTQHFVRSPGSSLVINLISPLVQRARVRVKYPTQEHNNVTQPRLAPRTFNLSTHPAGKLHEGPTFSHQRAKLSESINLI